MPQGDDHRRDDSSEFDWSSDDGLDPEEKAAEERALVKSFETLKKAKDAANRRCGSGC
jgi:hypothetical protein